MLQPVISLIICFIVWLIWSFLNKRYLKDFFSPFNLLLYFWVLPFLGSFMLLSELQDGLSLETTLVIVVSTMILVITSMVPMLVLEGRPLTIRYTYSSLTLIRKGSWLVVVFFLATLIALYWAEFREGVPLLNFMRDVTVSHAHRIGKDSRLQVFAAAIPVAGMFSFFLGLNSRTWGSKLLFMGLAFFVFILGVLKTSKSDMFIPTLFYFALYFYHSRPKKISINGWSAILLIFIGVLLIGVTFMRMGEVEFMTGYAAAIGFKYSNVIVFPLNEAIALVYGYMCLGFQNFSNYMGYGDGGFYIGTSMFRPFFSIVMQGDLVKSLVGEPPLHEGHFISGAAIGGTFLRALYMEGGVTFCFLGSGVYGVLLNGVYTKFRKMEGGMWMFIYIVFLLPWVLLFFQNAFSVLTIYINAFYVFAIFSLILSLKGRKLPDRINNFKNT